MYNPEFMEEAVRLSLESVHDLGGGPFGAVVAKNGRIVGRGKNRVTSTLDPTAHAEIVAVREACRHLNEFSLAGYDLYASCQPCPMCLAAAHWARINTIYFANTTATADQYGFDDGVFYQAICGDSNPSGVKLVHVDSPRAIEAFEEWKLLEGKIEY